MWSQSSILSSGISDKSIPLEENNTIVEDEVDSSKLLHHLKTNTKKSASDIRASMSDITLEAIGPASEI